VPPETGWVKTHATRALLLVGLVYLAAGLLFGLLSGRAGSHQGVVAWRLAAWVLSAVAFGGHILYEQLRLGSSHRNTAFHAAGAAALGAFGLAVAANVHARMVHEPQHAVALGLSLVIWPLLAALPAFLVALVAAVVLARVRRSL
jgi:hypothetical protein